MRTRRLLGAAFAATIAAIAPLSTTIAAAAEPTGVGTGNVSSTLLSVNVGDGVLSVDVLGDSGTSTIDPAKGASSGSTSATPLTIASTAVPALNVSSPSVGTSSTGAEDKKSVEPSLPAVPGFSGSLKLDLSSVVDTLGARSGLTAAVSNLTLVGGLLSVPSAAVNFGTDAATAKTSSVRGVDIPSIEVLDLAAVLEAIGLPLDSLPLDTLQDLLGTLGIALPNLDDPAAVVASVNAALDALQGQTGALTTAICTQVDGILGTVGGLAGTDAAGNAAGEIIDTVTGGGGLPLPNLPLQAAALPSCASVTGTVQDLVNSLQAVVGDVVGSVLAALGDTPLLSVQGIKVGTVADAASTVESSLADVTGTIGSVKVGALAVPGLTNLDLTSALGVLTAAGDAVTAAVGQVLGVINAQLANMVDVDVMKITETVAPDGSYTSATAAVTALTATLTPPALLTGALDLGTSAGALLGQVGAAVPALAPLMAQLEAALGGLDLLTAPTTITVGQLSSQSSFAPAVAPVPGSTGELPRTGGNAAVPAMAAVLVAGIALGIRRYLNALAA